MTASWEKGLNQIAEGQISGELYKEKLYNYVRNTVAAIKNASAPEDPGLEPFESCLLYTSMSFVKLWI